jgi:hypothetical protein
MDADITRPKIINKILINLARAENIVAVLDRIWRFIQGNKKCCNARVSFLRPYYSEFVHYHAGRMSSLSKSSVNGALLKFILPTNATLSIDSYL